MSKNTLSIIIPVFNEAKTVQTLIEQVVSVSLGTVEKEIIIVESNSTDGTRDIVKDLASRHPLRVFYEDRPQGKGHAVKTGLSQATGTWVVIQDADLEYDVADYPKLLAPLVSGEASFVLGSRHLGHRHWRYRNPTIEKWHGDFLNLGVWILTKFFNLLYGTSLTDPCTMYKVFRREGLEGITFLCNGFDMDWEIVAKLVRKGLTPLEVPVTYRSRSNAEGKKVRIWRDGWRSVVAIIRFRF